MNAYKYPPRAFRHMLLVLVCRELHPQLEFYEFPGGVGSSRWRWELQPLHLEFLKGCPRFSLKVASPPPPSRPPKIQLFRSSAASCALVRQPWRQDVHTSPKIAKTTSSNIAPKTLPRQPPGPSRGGPSPQKTAKVIKCWSFLHFGNFSKDAQKSD